MALEAGDEYDCPTCGGTHEIRRGKDLQVPGSSEPLGAGLYVRCPEVGVFDPAEGPPNQRSRDRDESNGDWP